MCTLAASGAQGFLVKSCFLTYEADYLWGETLYNVPEAVMCKGEIFGVKQWYFSQQGMRTAFMSGLLFCCEYACLNQFNVIQLRFQEIPTMDNKSLECCCHTYLPTVINYLDQT